MDVIDKCIDIYLFYLRNVNWANIGKINMASRICPFEKFDNISDNLYSLKLYILCIVWKISYEKFC